MPASVLTVAAKQALPQQSTVRRFANEYVPNAERNVAPTERLGGVTGALQTFQESDFQRLLLRLAAEGFDQALQLTPIR